METNNGEEETRQSLAEGHGITFPNAQEAIRWLKQNITAEPILKQAITIEVPSNIPRILTPNRSRVAHWGQITKAKNHLQGITLVCAIDARNRWLKAHPEGVLPFEKGLLWYDLVVKDRRSQMDDDNAIAGLKFCRDMLQVATNTRPGAGIIGNDRDFLTASVHWTIEKGVSPHIIITVESTGKR